MDDIAEVVSHIGNVLYNVCCTEDVSKSEEIKITKLKNLQEQKKLCLILDLDHTLVHSIFVNKEYNFLKPASCSENNEIFQLKTCFWEENCITKIRPFVRKFLEEASKLFELYIYTLGRRYYAKRIARILDPKSVYFGPRIIAYEDSTSKSKKGLDVVPNIAESVVLILDDTEHVWSKHSRNLMKVNRYKYFESFYKTIRVLEDETESSGALSHSLEILKQVHELYYNRDDLSEDCDVRDLLQIVNKKLDCS